MVCERTCWVCPWKTASRIDCASSRASSISRQAIELAVREQDAPVVHLDIDDERAGAGHRNSIGGDNSVA